MAHDLTHPHNHGNNHNRAPSCANDFGPSRSEDFDLDRAAEMNAIL